MVKARVDYSGFAQAYGAGYASRLKLVAYPGCSLTTPEVPECLHATEVVTANNPVKQEVSAVLPVGDTTTSAADMTDPAATDPAAPTATTSPDPTATDLTATDLTATDPTATELSDPVATDPAKADPAALPPGCSCPSVMEELPDEPRTPEFPTPVTTAPIEAKWITAAVPVTGAVTPPPVVPVTPRRGVTGRRISW